MFNCNLNVTHRKYNNYKPKNIMSELIEQEKTKKYNKQQELMESIHIKHENIRKENEINKSVQDRVVFNHLKEKVIENAYKVYPSFFIAHIMSSITANALPHDESYIHENYNEILTTQFGYIYRLGGLKYLKERVITTKSPFLQTVYEVAKKRTNEVINRKRKELDSCVSIDDVRKCMDLDLTTDETDGLSNDISKMNVDDISELVQKKVISVIQDESKREEDNAKAIGELKDKIDEYESKEQKKDMDALSNPDKEDKEMNKDIEKSSTKESSLGAIESIYKYAINKPNLKKASLFFTMMQENAKRLKGLPTNKSKVVLESPLNVNVEDIYMNDPTGDLAKMDFVNISSKKPLAGDMRTVDPSNITLKESNMEEILSETITQYAMLETAHTVKLIDISTEELRKYTDTINNAK